MTKHNQDGAVGGIGISLILTVVLLIVAICFGGWAFASRQDYKDKSDAKVDAAVVIAKQEAGKVKDAEFAEELKNPLATYNGPESYGSLVIKYPKTWGGYVDSGSALINGYFAPGIVPSLTSANSVFALRFQILNQSYSSTVKSYASIPSGPGVSYTTAAYSLPKLPKVVGIQIVGKLSPTGPAVAMVVLPLRTQTIRIWTEGPLYTDDFNKYVLPNVTFSP